MRRLALAPLALVAAAFLCSARADAPLAYAITGARIVPVASAPIESGTLVLRGGLIEAVGASVKAPPDAETIDGKGLTIYPGLIDMGNTGIVDRPPAQQPQSPKTRAEIERWKRSQLLQPQRSSASLYKVDSPELAKLARAGVLSVLALPPGEGFTGQSALLDSAGPPDEPQIGSLAEARRGLTVRNPAVAEHVVIAERPQGETYPEALMGMIAFVRQAFLDARHLEAESAWARRTRKPAPAADPALEGLQHALARRVPVAFAASQVREIRRALAMARELELDLVVVGGLEADQAAPELLAQKARVIFSLNYPERPKSLAPDADEPVRALRERANAPKVPAALSGAGVTFAFESAGLKEPRQFLANAAKAVKAGLTPEAALRALTLDAARIAGVADRIGSIEKGKVANVVVTAGDLFASEMAVRYVFAAGRPVPLTERP